MKKVIRIIVIILIIYCTCYITCEYNAYKAEKEIYLNIYDNSYGTTENGTVINKTFLSFFDGDYVKTKYAEITDIVDAEWIEKISLSDKYHVDEIYIVHPNIKVYVVYNDLIYEKKVYTEDIRGMLKSLRETR